MNKKLKISFTGLDKFEKQKGHWLSNSHSPI